TAATLGALVALADPGPAQIMGYHGAASEILIAFAARHDLHIAALKAGIFALILLPVLLPLALKISTWLASVFIGRDVRKFRPWSPRGWRWLLALIFPIVPLLLLAPAVYGLLRPLLVPPVKSAAKYALDAFQQS